MAAMAEGRMNLAALQHRDPFIIDIIDTAAQVALYIFNSQANEWEKTDIEGTLFVYTRSAAPINGYMILNRLGLNNLIEPITKALEFQLQDPFLLYKNASKIYGIWFYDKDECARIGQLMNSLVQVSSDAHKTPTEPGRQRRASESDTFKERPPEEMTNAEKNVDILQMLSKAQDEYDKSSKSGTTPVKKDKPKPMIDNPNAAATKHATSLIKPTAVLGHLEGEGDGQASAPPVTPNTAISLEALFKTASIDQHNAADLGQHTELHRSHSVQDATKSTVSGPVSVSGPGIPEFLQGLMSNHGATPATLEEIERGSSSQAVKNVKSSSSENHDPRQDIPESPNTDLKRRLNMLPPHPSTITKHVDYKTVPLPAVSVRPNGTQITQAYSDAISSSTVKTAEKEISKGLITPGSMAGPRSNVYSSQQQGLNLVTPGALSQTSLPVSAGSMPPKQSLSASSSTNVLITPDAFQAKPQAASTSEAPTQKPVFNLGGQDSISPVPSIGGPAELNPLTKEQMQQALIYMIKHDPHFMAKLHEAYVKSLTESLFSKH
ncbi:unnamed protein product [Owenia fusiformis]|uniref:5'-(N(7)-methylguanosine 5'-triphospho)-[mRNA] hydrolase n=1 Tax=Owenia fusiformis TaxID=6347 RepID=A0A8S4NRQ1_OWEFU|nr:unnamed protein product [Owenia fusiformis]